MLKKLLFASFFFFTGAAVPQQVLDKIVAVVDNEIILQSELDFQVQMAAQQKKLDPSNPKLREQILNSIIEEKLVYAQSNIDSIVVSEEEVRRQIDYQIEVLSRQYGSKDRLEEIYGMSMEKIRRELRENVRKELMIQRVQEKKFGNIESSRRDVEEFFRQYKDSLGIIPEKVKIAHIFRYPKLTDAAKARFRDRAIALLDSFKAGKDFAELARLYSEDTKSAPQGGDLGFQKRGSFYPECEAAVFALQPNEVSAVVESPDGYHLLQLIEKRGDSFRARQILIKIKADDDADLLTIELLSSLRDSILANRSRFPEFAKRYSEDQETVNFGGQLGTFYLEQLDRNLLDAVGKLKEGDVSFPKRVTVTGRQYGYHIIYLEKRINQHKPDLEIDYAEMKKLADDLKKQKLYQAWIEELKSKIFWEIKL